MKLMFKLISIDQSPFDINKFSRCLQKCWFSILRQTHNSIFSSLTNKTICNLNVGLSGSGKTKLAQAMFNGYVKKKVSIALYL